jgi:hypothetical protein
MNVVIVRRISRFLHVIDNLQNIIMRNYKSGPVWIITMFSQNFTYSVFGNIASNSEIIEYYFNDNYYRNKITNNKPYIVAYMYVFNKEAMRFT